MTAGYPALKAIFGMGAPISADEYKGSEKAIKDAVRAISTELASTGKDWIAGSDSITLADFCLASLLQPFFQTILPTGIFKGPDMGKANDWFKRVAAHPAYVKINGKIVPCERALKPLLQVVAKKSKEDIAAEAQKVKDAAAAAKAKKEAEKKAAEALVPKMLDTDFDLYNYKTFLVNVPDKKGEGMATTKEMFQSPGFNDGFSWWHVRYQKYGDEGQVQHKFNNLLGGVMQRCDPKLSKQAFARMLMIGDEPNLEIEGVWMFRGQEIPAEMADHPQWEYFDKRKLDFMGNAEDYALVGEFFACPKFDGVVTGRAVREQEWFK